MIRSRAALVYLIATSALIGCATQEQAQDVELDNLADALDQATLAGDLELAMELGHDFVGLRVDGANPSRHPVDGFISGIFTAAEDGGPVAELRGRMMYSEDQELHQLGGVMAAPLEGQSRGAIAAETLCMASEVAGGIIGDYATSRDNPEEGFFRGVWNLEDATDTTFIKGRWQLDSNGEGRLFGVFVSIPEPTWDRAVRVQIDVAGLTELRIGEDVMWVSQAVADESFEGTIGGALVNGAPYELVYSETSCPDGAGEGCNSEPYLSPEDAAIDLSAGAELITRLGRGKITLVEEASADNGMITTVAIDDRDYEGVSTYNIEIRPAR
jgi:hypothetical protein